VHIGSTSDTAGDGGGVSGSPAPWREPRGAAAAALAGATEADEVLEAIGDRALPELGQSVLSLWMVAPGGDAIHLAGGYGYVPDVPAQVGGVPLDSDLPAAVAVTEQRPVWYGSRQERNERWPVLAGVGGRSEATVVMPLVARGEAFGCLAFGFDEQRTFDDDQLSVFEAVTGECALALDRVRLIERERETRGVLEFLAEATQLLVASRDPVQLVHRLAGLAVPELADWCAIYLAEEAGLRLVASKPDAVVGVVRKQLTAETLVIPYDSPVPAARVWRSGEDEEVVDVAAEIERASLDPDVGAAARTLGISSAVVVPIRAGGEVVGIMSTAYAATRVRTDVHQFAVNGLAARAGVAPPTPGAWSGSRMRSRSSRRPCCRGRCRRSPATSWRPSTSRPPAGCAATGTRRRCSPAGTCCSASATPPATASRRRR
jgi:GAF domain-containing protein